MTSVVLGMTIFEDSKFSKKRETKLKSDLKKMKENYELNKTTPTFSNKRITTLEKDCKGVRPPLYKHARKRHYAMRKENLGGELPGSDNQTC